MKRWMAFAGVLGVIFLSAILVKAGVLNVSPSAFASQEGGSEYAIASGGWGDYVFRPTGAADTYAVAPVDLPNSVLIRNVRFHYLDNDASSNIFMCVTRSNKYTGDHHVLYNYTSTGASSSIQYYTDYSVYPSPSYALTNLGACSYQAGIRIYAAGTELRCYGITIEYDPYL